MLNEHQILQALCNVWGFGLKCNRRNVIFCCMSPERLTVSMMYLSRHQTIGPLSAIFADALSLLMAPVWAISCDLVNAISEFDLSLYEISYLCCPS